MASTPSDPRKEAGTPRPSGLLARLKGMVQALRPTEETPPASPAPAPAPAAEDELIPTWDNAPPAVAVATPAPAEPAPEEPVPPAETIPLAAPIEPSAAIPLATPVEGNGPSPEIVPAVPVAEPVVLPAPATVSPEAAQPEAAEVTETPEVPEVAEMPTAPEAVPEAAPVVIEAPPAPALTCPVCSAPHGGERPSCPDCGYYFSPADLAPAAPLTSGQPAQPAEPAVLLQDRFEVGALIAERHGVQRLRGLDHGAGGQPVPVVIVRQQVPPPAEEPVAAAVPVEDNDEVLPSFGDALPATSPTEVLPALPAWPSVAWEHSLLTALEHPSLPVLVAHFQEGDSEYLVEEVPVGRSLWDAWDDPDVSSEQKYAWLAQVADGLHALHQFHTILEGLRPDVVVIAEDGRARLTDLGDLLPLPLPTDAPVRGSLYTAPELLNGSPNIDARADLYSFGAMLYALHVGRELSEGDFDRPGQPKPFIPRFPDIHPAFGRLVTKTFRREVEARFPTDEASREDSTGFTELMRTLGVLGRTMDRVRLEIAAWTTTGIVRTGNEDAFALLHACESRQDDTGEMALVLLCDGMGGYEAGEVAAALAIQSLRQNLISQKPFAALAGASAFADEPLSSTPHPEGHLAPGIDVEACKQILKAALLDANKQVFTASRAPGSRRRGMGCTAEVVFIDGRHVVVGHVGDSRTYHLHEGRLVQLTRDQTLVNRLVELGTLSPEEAETHPRRNELQQAIGGQPTVEPGLSHGVLKPGDWVVVCSDGLSNHINANDLKQMLLSEAQSAEMAARRLVNFTNIQGATDNATVVVIRVT
jgi:serine/threonine protein phosphatase PrpC